MSAHCRLCGRSVTTTESLPAEATRRVSCRVCGEYEIDGRSWHAFAEMGTDPSDRHLLSALARTAPVRGVDRIRVDDDSFIALQEGRIRERTFVEKRDGLLDWIAYESRKNPRSAYGAAVEFNPQTDYPVAYCRPLNGDWAEWNFISQPLRDRALIDVPENGKLRITDKGWEQLESRPKASGAQGFIAMAFKEMDPVRDAIWAGIERAGYKPMRIDHDEFVGGIMDRVVAQIRDSRFV